MPALVIRKHQRFATVHVVRVSGAGEGTSKALLIELSLEGCRLGSVEGEGFASGDYITIQVNGFRPIEGCVRWQGDATYGLRLLRPFHVAELDQLLQICRTELQAGELRHASMI